MSTPARRHDAGDVPTGCPPATPRTSPGISGSPPLSGADVRRRHCPSEPDLLDVCVLEHIDVLATVLACPFGPSAAVWPSSQVVPCFSNAHITRTR